MSFNLPPAVNASDDAIRRLRVYLDLLRRWNPTINLVGPGTLTAAEERHITDSAQVWPLLPPSTKHLVDMGSGAGFPGLVLAILGVPHVTLIESDQRKATFLREVARATATPGVTIIARRLEEISASDLPAGPADVVTARALAPLAELLDYAQRFLAQKGVCVFLKGRSADEEEALAQKKWRFKLEKFPSQTDPQGALFRISELTRV